ncbi:MAG: hypothetical protein RLY50_352 [Actinomycetota bacterium]|jgi:hypothetical protein
MTLDALTSAPVRAATRVVQGRGVHLDLPTNGHLPVVPWHDPVVDLNGEATTGDYVEWFWLPVLGPTATWLLRRLSAHVAGADEGDSPAVVDLAELARSIGVTWHQGHEGPFSRALTRCVMFGACAPIAGAEPLILAVRLAMPHLPARHVGRLPLSLRASHTEWIAAVRTTLSESQAG